MTQKQCDLHSDLFLKRRISWKKLKFLFDEPKSFENSISWNRGYIIWFQRCIGTQSVHPHVLFDEPPSELSFLNIVLPSFVINSVKALWDEYSCKKALVNVFKHV
jgi:hypothetical protein